jgi:hypothetical protein
LLVNPPGHLFGQVFRISQPWVISDAGGPPLELDRRGTAPIRALRRRHGPRRVGARPKRRRRRKGARGNSASRYPFNRPEPCGCFLYRNPMSEGEPDSGLRFYVWFASDCATVRSSPGAPPLPCERACSAPLPAWSPGLPRGRWRPRPLARRPSSVLFSLVLGSSSFVPHRPRRYGQRTRSSEVERLLSFLTPNTCHLIPRFRRPSVACACAGRRGRWAACGGPRSGHPCPTLGCHPGTAAVNSTIVHDRRVCDILLLAGMLKAGFLGDSNRTDFVGPSTQSSAATRHVSPSATSPVAGAERRRKPDTRPDPGEAPRTHDLTPVKPPHRTTQP